MRNTKLIPIDRPGRDQGKLFLLTEMPASQGEKWAARAWIAIAHANPQIPPEFLDAGWAGIAMVSINALSNAKFEEIEPLMDEMFQCVKIIPDPRKIELVRGLIEEDIQEIETRLFLRKAVFELHAGPFIEGVKSKLTSTPKKRRRASRSASTSRAASRS